MARRFVSQLAHQESVDQVFLASEKQLRPNRNGNLYLQVDLSDRSGSISARMWNASESDYRSFENGDYVQVEGSTQLFQGAIQLIATGIRRAPADLIHQEDFQNLDGRMIEQLVARLTAASAEDRRSLSAHAGRMLSGRRGLHAQVLPCAGRREKPSRLHRRAAGTRRQPDGPGPADHGLYANLDTDLLLMGAFLHDVGKIDELAYEREFTYTDEGQLIGHLVMAVGMLDRKIAEAEKLSGEAMPVELCCGSST